MVSSSVEEDSLFCGSVAAEGPLELTHLERSLDVLRAKALEPYCDLAALRTALEEGAHLARDTVLVKGSWLSFCRRSVEWECPPYRQQVPLDAICSPETVLK
jgi:hypothetical protein